MKQKKGDAENTYCYKNKCPADHPYIEGDSAKECKDKCPSGVKYFYINEDDNKVCAKECSSGHEYINGNECVSSCPDDTFLQDETKKVCGPTCASGKFKTDFSKEHYVCLASDKKCDSEGNGGKLSEIVTINGKDYTHCIADCSETYLKDVTVFKYDEKKCVTREQCNADNRYVFYVPEGTHLCLSLQDCAKKDSNKGVAFAVGECKAIAVKEDDFTKDKDTGVYTCKDSKYLYFDTEAECVDFAGCNDKTDTVIYEPTKQCLSNNECTEYM